MAKKNFLKEEISNFLDSFQNALRKEPKEMEISSEQRKQNEQLVARLKELEAKYKERNMPPEPDYDALFAHTLGLEPKPVPIITDEDIEERATTALLPDYTKKVNKMELDTTKSLSSMEDKVTDADIKYAEDMTSLDKAFDSLMRRQTNELIKQGIIHSSISFNTLSDSSSEAERVLGERTIKYEATMERFNAAIELIEQNRAYALQEYELKFAADLDGKIIALKKERDSLIAAINTYNAKVVKDEAAYQKYREDTIRKMETDRLAAYEQREKEIAKREQVTGYTGAKAAEMDARYNYALQFYSSLPKDVALTLMRENEETLKSTLGTRYADLAASQLGR